MNTSYSELVLISDPLNSLLKKMHIWKRTAIPNGLRDLQNCWKPYPFFASFLGKFWRLKLCIFRIDFRMTHTPAQEAPRTPLYKDSRGIGVLGEAKASADSGLPASA